MTNIEIVEKARNTVYRHDPDEAFSPEELGIISAALGIPRIALRDQKTNGWISVKDRLPERPEHDWVPGSCTECKYGDRYGCVGDVKCRILREYFTGNVEPPYKDCPDECPLVEQLEPPNDPLTLEELREMDGEPVWIVTGSAINAGRGCWDICDWWDKDTVTFPYSGEQPRIGECGITWCAYRRKPEEGAEYGKQV